MSLTATLAVIPAGVDLAQDSVKRRQAIAVLRVPRTFQIRGSQILHPAMYYQLEGVPEESEKALHLVTVVSSRPQAEAARLAWNSVKAEPSIRRVGMNLRLVGVGEDPALAPSSEETAVNLVKDPGQFSARTGIRVIPFSLIMRGDDVLAAGPGLPDLAFVRDTAERFIRDGVNAATVFRPMTLELAVGLASIEALFPDSPAAR